MYIRCLGHQPVHVKYHTYQQLHTDFWSMFSVPFITEGSLFSLASPLRTGSTGCWEEKAFLIQKHAGTSTFSGINNRLEGNPAHKGNWFSEPSSEWESAPWQAASFTVTIQSSQERYVSLFMNTEVNAKKSPCARRWRLVIGIKREFWAWLSRDACGRTLECAEACQVIWSLALHGAHREELKRELKAGDSLNLSDTACFPLGHV